MLTYVQTVELLAQRVTDNYFGGSNQPWLNAGLTTASDIYQVEYSKFHFDVDKVHKKTVTEVKNSLGVL